MLQNQPLPANIDLHDLVERNAVLAPVVELGGAGRRMRRHLTGLLQRAAVLEVSRDAGAAKGVVPPASMRMRGQVRAVVGF